MAPDRPGRGAEDGGAGWTDIMGYVPDPSAAHKAAWAPWILDKLYFLLVTEYWHIYYSNI
jgi:hypothetical protein